MITLITGSSSDHLFQVYYKVRQVLLQSATAFFITKCDDLFMTKCDSFFLQSATSVVTKCDCFFYCKVRWSVTKCDSFFITKCYYNVRQVLQSVTILLQGATGITKCDDYYKVRQNIPGLSAAAISYCFACLIFLLLAFCLFVCFLLLLSFLPLFSGWPVRPCVKYGWLPRQRHDIHKTWLDTFCTHHWS